MAAVTFWLFTAMNGSYSIEVVHPLHISYDPEQYVPVSKPPEEIRFSTTATGWDLLQRTSFISSTPIEIELDDFKKRRYITANRIKPIVENQMRGIKINYVQDDTIWVDFERKRNQKIPVSLDIKKYLAEGEELDGPVILNPKEVEVTGPGSAVRKAPSKFTLELPSKNISGEYEEEVEAKSDLDDLKIVNPTIKVRFKTVSLEKESKELKAKRVNFPKKKTISVSAESFEVTFFFRKSDQGKWDVYKPELILDYSRLDEKKKTIRPQLKNVPEWLRSYTVEPTLTELKYGE